MNAPTLQNADRLAIVGMTGTGKSFYGKACLAEWMTARRVVGVDLKDELSIHGVENDEQSLGPLKQRVDYEEFTHNPAKYLDRADLSLAVVLADAGGNKEAAEQLVDVMEQVKFTGNLLLYVEEVGYFTDVNSGARAVCEGKLNEAATLWRSRRIPCVFLAQRTMQLTPGVRGSLSQIVGFQQTYDDDLAELGKLTKRIDPNFADAVARLAPRQSKLWRKESPCTAV